jgi:hypothetical protein
LRRPLYLLAPLLLLLGMACALLAEPPRPVVPSPPATAPPISEESLQEIVRSQPVDPVLVSADADIVALLNEVSRQNLMAYVQELDSFGTRNTFSDSQRDDFGIGASRRWLHREFERVGAGRLHLQFDDFQMNFGGLVSNQRNVVATLPGSGAHSGLIILMAHYDSRTYDPADGIGRAPGANDNASGVALLLEVARLMSSRTWNQTVMFVAFAGEEQGTFGSRHFVRHMMLDGRIIDAAINNDIIGGRPGIPYFLRVFAPDPDTSNTRQLVRYMGLIGSIYLPHFPLELQSMRDREGRFSDHLEFTNAGIASVRLTESVEDFTIQHTGQDTWDRLDYEYLAHVVQLNLAVVASMAAAPAPPPAPAVAPMADAGSYLLTWVPQPEVVTYLIALRRVGSDEFEPFRYVAGSEMGQVVLRGLDPQAHYAISLAAVDGNGRLSYFSTELLVGSNP